MRLPLKNLFPNLRGAPAVTTIALACVAVFAIQAVATSCTTPLASISRFW